MSLRPRGLVVCVDYADLLEITLPRNLHHFSELVVVTHPEDRATRELVERYPPARYYLTDAFYRHGAKFNKGLALEEGFDALGREGWILVWDADTLFPENWPEITWRVGWLYGARRRILENPADFAEGLDWSRLPPGRDLVWAGYFQLFHADDPHLRRRPWYDVTFSHAGGCDGYFQRHWPVSCKCWLPFEVLHLGPRDCNWFGRVTPRRDGTRPAQWEERSWLMRSYLEHKGWLDRWRTGSRGRKNAGVWPGERIAADISGSAPDPAGLVPPVPSGPTDLPSVS